MELVKLNNTGMTSLKLVEQINIFRKEEDNKSELAHSDLLKIIREEFEEEIAEGNISCGSYKDKNNQDRPMFDLTLSQAKQVLVRESKIVRKAVIKYIEELEKKLNNQFAVPQTYKEALIELVNAIELKEQAENQVKMLTHQNKLYTSSEIAKELNLRSANELNKILEEIKVQYKVNGTWISTSRYSDKNYTSVKQTVLDNGKVVYDRKWTGFGREFILTMIGGK